MTSVPDRFCYVYSCDLDVNVQIKIGTLEGVRDKPSYNELIADPMLKYSGVYQDDCSDMYVTCQVYSDGKPLALATQTSYKAFTTRWNWNEWLTLPVKYSDLPRNAQVALTIWDIYGPRKVVPVGGTVVSLFGKNGTFRQGMHDLRVWPNVEADGLEQTTTPGKVGGATDEMSRLAKLTKKHRNGHMVKVDWLDRLTFREIEVINEKQKRDSNFMYLMIEFPQIHYDGTKFAVVYFEKDADEMVPVRQYAEIVTVPDPEIGKENLVESKHHKLARRLRSAPTDKDLKPNAAVRDQLNVIVSYPPTKQLTSEEQDLIWKFRFYLSAQKKALTKFLKSVAWSVPQEEKQGLDMMYKWSPMDAEDALELLSPAFTNPAVRKYAVSRLMQADDEELLLYLLQLVQALKYEDFDVIREGLNHISAPVESPRKESDPSQLGEESDTQSLSQRSPSIGSKDSGDILDELSIERPSHSTTNKHTRLDLATCLIERACNNSILANYFYWFLLVECDDQDSQAKDPKVMDMYISVLKRFSQTLSKGGQEHRHRRACIAGQQAFMDRLVQVVKAVARESGNRKKKVEKLQSLLTDQEVSRFNFTNFDPLPLPLDPEVKVKAIAAEHVTLLKSQLMPCKLYFKTVDRDDHYYITLFKHGDDLRQDQLIIQMIILMDKLMRRENLDLKLTPYKAIATSCKHGFIQFIDSMPIANIVDEHTNILNYLRKYNPVENGPYGIAPEVMDNYVKSCAGYSVITYLLGVGDRHLDNILIANNGKLFHVDFGYILGRDPKPMPSPMRLSKEMIEAMGGMNSEHFLDFKKLCYTAFLALRRSANLILNLFSLMIDANVPDIALEPDKTVKKVQDKFHFDLNDEEAVQNMQNIIDVSASATMAALMEQMHRLAQYWRK
ncbi:unnamed protein product [Owenia fusiformis]|uniref:Phosphatidylinositol 3-kinase catalytic subunit type 3 n=1 Tax=Owenia fusiformis TaxID=6347 RepID=A0A8S4PXN5_OWEFU|nr:unnamed protein product [Owenia fusiformis]